jgi:PAS domain S-box-containing protein
MADGLEILEPQDAVIMTDCSGRIVHCDPVAALLSGYVADELVGRPVEILVPPEEKVREAEIRRRIVAGEHVPPYRACRIRRDGSRVRVSVTTTSMADAAGGIVGAVTVVRPVGDPEDDQDDTARRVELQRIDLLHAWDEFELGIDAERAQERVDVHNAGDRFEARMVSERAREREQVQEAGGRLQGGADAERPEAQMRVEDASEPFQVGYDAGRAEARDDREQLEGQLRQSQRLEVLGQLAGGVAHDFNNLLGVILNYAEFVTDEIASGPLGDLAAISHDVAQIRRAAERAAVLTRQLLAFARREVIQPRVLDLNIIVADMEQLLRRTLGAEVVLRTTLATEPWPVLVDAGQMEQVLVNLAVNARDAMNGGGGVLEIDTANIVIADDFPAAGSPVRSGQYIRLRVRDTGSGMPAHVIERVFEPFFTTKADGSGTGLGLATVYGIVVQAGGAIDIGSQPGVGTTITILIPVTSERPEVLVEASPRRRAATGGMVLIVEDDAALRDVTERIFNRAGYQVIAAPDGHRAVALAAQYDGEIDLLVTDVVMPNMLGKEVVEEIRRLRSDIAVLYMSGYAQPVLASHGQLDPGINLIEKPFSATAIIEKAGQVLSGRRQERRASVPTGQNSSRGP